MPVENSQNIRWGNCQGSGTTQPVVSWFIGHDSHRVRNLCGLPTCRGSCFYPTANGRKVSRCWEFTKFPTAPFSTDFDAGHGINARKPHICHSILGVDPVVEPFMFIPHFEIPTMVILLHVKDRMPRARIFLHVICPAKVMQNTSMMWEIPGFDCLLPSTDLFLARIWIGRTLLMLRIRIRNQTRNCWLLQFVSWSEPNFWRPSSS